MNFIIIITGIISIICMFFCVYLFSIVKKNKRKIILYENLLQNNESDLRDIEKIFRKEILKQSKKILLFDKLKEEEKNLCLNYYRFRETKNKYDTLNQNQSNNLTNEIIEEIETYILPDYFIEQQRQKNMSNLTKISYLTAFLSLIPVINDISKFCLLLTLYPLIKLTFLNAPRNYEKRKQFYFNLLSNFLLLAFIISDIYFSLFVYFHWWTDFDAEVVLMISIICTVILLAFKIIKYFYLRKNGD